MQGKDMPEPSAATRVYVGIDVCKAWLDVHVHPLGHAFRVSNDLVGLRALKKRLRPRHVALIVMEATGKYHRHAQRTLHDAGFAVAVVNPLRSRLFAEALGALAKTDRIDARLLALMGESLEPKALSPASMAFEELQEIVRARHAATAELTALTNRLGETKSAYLKAELGRQVKSLAARIKRFTAEILKRIKDDPALLRRYNVLVSIPGIGPVCAATLLVELRELGQISKKAIALLAGLAPLADDTGNTQGVRRIRGGRIFARVALYMPAVAAIAHNPTFKAFYQRLLGAGKKPKQALTAVMRKLLVLANALVRDNRLWELNRA
jgi:transposase